jgi:signal transduction histidine kinase
VDNGRFLADRGGEVTTGDIRRILLVDDDGDDRAQIRRLLREQQRSFEVVEESRGADAVRRCRAERFDCVLLDYYLPDMDGGEFLRAIRRNGQGPTVAVTVLTGVDEDVIAAEVLQGGAQDFIEKDGLTSRSLVRAIENTIEKFRILQELEKQRAALELRTWQLETVRDELQSKLVELSEAHQAKDQFLAVMSHEMRTPLNAILGYADLMEMGIGGAIPEAQRSHLDRIRVGGRHLLDLINDLLDLSRADAQKLELDLRAVDVSSVIEEVAALLGSQATVKGLTIEIEPCEAPTSYALADLRRLRQALTNLIGNAVKFTDEGSVRVGCRPGPDETLEIYVSDTGIGIESHVLPLVFTEFYQARGSLTREQGGSGLGLAITQRLARAMGGDIHAESRVGEGSTFTLTVPAAGDGALLRGEDIDAHDLRMEQHAAIRRNATQRRGVVVAFGENSDSLEELASRVGASVDLVWTTRADEVATIAKREGATLVVLDITCADGAAWRVASSMQDDPDLGNTAVLLLPRIPTPAMDDAEGELDLGWVSVVPKPFTQQQIRDAVSHAALAGRGKDEDGDGAAYEVLVVDDDPDSRRVASQFLTEANARVREAADGETALVAMRRRRPDVVVLDLMMPVLDGFGVLAAMQSDPALASIPVVVLSAKTLTEPERRFLARTAVRVLQKGEHRLADVASLVLRAAARIRPSTADHLQEEIFDPDADGRLTTEEPRIQNDVEG